MNTPSARRVGRIGSATARGCVEAAVISGRLAAHTIAQAPALADIIGYSPALPIKPPLPQNPPGCLKTS